MRTFTLIFLLAAFAGQLPAQTTRKAEMPPPYKAGQDILASEARTSHSMKGGGDVFWAEDFDWADSASGIGWLLPAGWSLEDPGDIGYNWHWANDTLKGVYTNEPPLNSTSKGNGFLALNLDGYNQDLGHYDNYIAVNNSIISPKIDCSAHPSVLVKVEQNFRYWSEAAMTFEVSNDNGVHWALFDMKMGTLYSERVGHVPAGGKVDLYMNITDVAAGMTEVQFKITWKDARLYYWMIDDITFMEGWDNDIQMLYYQADYDNGTENDEGFFYAVPKTQISGYDMMAVIKNFGNLEQWGTRLEVQVTKNNQVIFDQSTTPYTLYPTITDTFRIEQQFIPEEFGHYKMDFSAKMDEADEIPADNFASIPFHITDSLFSRCDERPEVSFSTWGWYTYQHEGDMMGTWYTLKNDAEANSISVYIYNADIRVSFRLMLMGYSAEDDATYELLSSEMVQMDSTMLKNHWVTLPLQKDGEGEFLKAGDSYMACIELWNNLDFEEAYNTNRYSLGSDRDNYYPSGKSWFYFTNDQTWYSTGNDLLMLRLNLNDHSNVIDAVADTPAYGTELMQNYPNPFSGETSIQYTLSRESDIHLFIRDITGKIVMTREYPGCQAGENKIVLDGSRLEPGNYFYTLSGRDFNKTLRMMIMR